MVHTRGFPRPWVGYIRGVFHALAVHGPDAHALDVRAQRLDLSLSRVLGDVLEEQSPPVHVV